jgi:hypothetical protein
LCLPINSKALHLQPSQIRSRIAILGIKASDWVTTFRDRVAANEASAKKITDQVWADIEAQQKSNAAKTDIQQLTGTYKDDWFGEVNISVKNGKAWFESKRSPKLSGEMFAYKGSTYIVKWGDRSMDADAFVMFSLDTDGKATGIKMKAISPLTDFSYDFHDLDLKKMK